MGTSLSVEEKEKQITEKAVNEDEQDRKAASGGMPVYDINEP